MHAPPSSKRHAGPRSAVQGVLLWLAASVLPDSHAPALLLRHHLCQGQQEQDLCPDHGPLPWGGRLAVVLAAQDPQGERASLVQAQGGLDRLTILH